MKAKAGPARLPLNEIRRSIFKIRGRVGFRGQAQVASKERTVGVHGTEKGVWEGVVIRKNTGNSRVEALLFVWT